METSKDLDILFDDSDILMNLSPLVEPINLISNTDCDCIGYTDTEYDEDLETGKIAPSSGTAH